MIRSFFQHLEDHGVDWLLVSGQATILYGAATFSEDVDLWVDPTEQNLLRLRAALRASQARYYKLTPPLELEFAERHHGFHFVLPDAAGADWFLDVMASPPRVGAFETARRRSKTFDTEWGSLPTVGIPDLVELKKTQRPRDYPIITRLVLSQLLQMRGRLDQAQTTWALENVFTAGGLRTVVHDHAEIATALRSSIDAPGEAARTWDGGAELTLDQEEALDSWLEGKMAPLRRADRAFWRPVIDELRHLRQGGRLAALGDPV
jgi:hypothetical protein